MIQHGLTSHFTIFGIAMVCSVVGCDLAVIWVMAGKDDFSTFHVLSCPGGQNVLFGVFHSTVHMT
jgi:hypothetical protein